MKKTLCAIAALSTLSACAVAGPDGGEPSSDHGVGIELAALNLQGVGDVVWDLEVANGGGDVVWQRRITSSGYGDGAGSASYLGPCDADPPVAANTIKVWVVGVYATAVNDAGAFSSGADTGVGAVDGTPVAFQNPTTTTPLTRVVTCRENADVFAQFDVALMRPAQQGFFDVAVNFDNIFCSAKFDCCADADLDGSCASDGSEDIALLFQAGGGRASTMVLGLACTAGPRDDVETELYLDPLALDCTSPNDGISFVADITIDPSGAPGNQCVAGADGMSTCTGTITEAVGVDADTYLYQVGVYRGLEQLVSGGQAAQKVYWNIALGVKRPDIGACRLRTRATADDAAHTPAIADGTIAAGDVYPFLRWDVDLATCAEEALSFDDPAAMVRPDYTTTDGGADAFTYGFGPNMPAGAFCDPACQNGGTCYYGACVCPEGYGGVACEVAPFAQAATFTSNTTWLVPAGVTEVRVKVWGAGGGGGGTAGDYGGGGGFAQADLVVTPGETLYVQVGGGGGRASSPSGGTNGGGPGGNSGLGATGGGGGYSGLFRVAVTQANALVVAGAGGGGGHHSTGGLDELGGGGGGTEGTPGGPNSGGGAGTQTAGGAGYQNGSALAGGAGAGGDSQHYSIGGGGAGYFGGGSGNGFGTGAGTAGGGGSGYVTGSNTALTAGQGYAAAVPGTAANDADPDYVPGVGQGGPGNTDGGAGYVVIRY